MAWVAGLGQAQVLTQVPAPGTTQSSALQLQPTLSSTQEPQQVQQVWQHLWAKKAEAPIGGRFYWYV